MNARNSITVVIYSFALMMLYTPLNFSQELASASGADLTSSPAADSSKHMKTAEVMPELISKLNVVYPEDAVKAGLMGTVYVSLLISEQGTVEKVTVIRGVASSLDAAAVNAVKDAKFSPARDKGKAIKAEVVLPIKFKLDDEAKDSPKSGKNESKEPVPEIVGGMESFYKFFVYPKEAKEKGIQGKVILRAIVDEKGNLEGTMVVKGIGYGCDEAAEKALRSIKFKPAMKDGKPVKSQITLPVMFKLQ